MSRYANAERLDREILSKIALIGPTSQYDLYLEFKKEIAYKTILLHLRDLLKKHWVELKEIKKSSKGKDKKIFDLTQMGLFIIIDSEENILKDLKKVIKRHEDKIPFSNKLDYFIKNGLEKDIIFRILYAIKKSIENSTIKIDDNTKGLDIWKTLSNDGEEVTFSEGDNIIFLNDVTTYGSYINAFYDPFGLNKKEKPIEYNSESERRYYETRYELQEKFLAVISKEPDLRYNYTQYMELMIKDYEEILTKQIKWLKWFNELPI